MARWYVYILKCGDGTLYTGIATDVTRRLREHQQGIGAKYTRGRMPLRIVYRERRPTRSSASKREAEIKSMSRPEKAELIAL
jgi:predicted GIY-YIG superfamily endonuclease